MIKIFPLAVADSVSVENTLPAFLIRLDITSEDMAYISAILERVSTESSDLDRIITLSLLSIKIKELNHLWIHEPSLIDISSIEKSLENFGSLVLRMMEQLQDHQ